MTKEPLLNTAATALAAQTLITHLLILLKMKGLTPADLQALLTASFASLDADADPIVLRARVLLESVAELLGVE